MEKGTGCGRTCRGTGTAEVQDAFREIKITAGPDAVILNTRKVLTGEYEVTVAIDPELPSKVGVPVEVKRVKGESFDWMLGGIEPPGVAPVDLGGVKESMRATEHYLAIEERALQNPLLNQYYRVLRRGGAERETLAKLFERIFERWEPSGKSVEEISQRLIEHIAHWIRIGEAIDVVKGRLRTVVLVGPTGVGKTTTIAKIAATNSLIRRRKVGLISTDGYRMSAIDQLRSYAEIMKIPFASAMDTAELSEAISSFSDLDLVLVDTPGYSPFNSGSMQGLKELLQVPDIDEVHLLMNINTPSGEIDEIVRCYQSLGPTHCILTKLDENAHGAMLLNFPCSVNLPFSFVTYGQNVPDDIERADAKRLTKLIFGDRFYERSSGKAQESAV